MSIQNALIAINESSLPEKLADYLEMDVANIQKQIRSLNFSEYMSLATAIEEFDDETISSFIVKEGDNPYAKTNKPVTPSRPTGPASSSSNPLNLDIKGDDGEVDTTITKLDTEKNTAEIIDDTGRKRTVDIDKLEDKIEKNVLENLKRMAGII